MQTSHDTFRFVLILAQIFGMFPVTGITKKSHTHLKFKWKSVRTVYSIIFALFTLNDTVFQIVKMCKSSDLDFVDFVSLLFYLCNFVTVSIFIDLGRKWPFLMSKWTDIDYVMSCYGPNTGLSKKLKIITAIVMVSATFEHSLFIAFTWSNHPGNSFKDDLDSYLQTRYSHIFDIVPYNIYLGLMVQMFNMFCTFSWNFMDLFIMLMSVAIASRFHQIAEKVKFLAKNPSLYASKWKKIREDYTKLCIFCLTIDDTISNIILLSFANNLFVIIVQLFNSLKPRLGISVIGKVYFNYSFAFLIIRTISVALNASTVDSESREPTFALITLPSHIYNAEIERFLYQLKYDTAALTGHRLFRVTKSLLLSVTGAIVTYELILIQFNNSK